MAVAGITDVAHATAAAAATATELGLAVDTAIVLHASNRIAVRLVPSDVLARVAPAAHRAAQFEVDLAARLQAVGSPVAPLDPRVAPQVYERDGYDITLWTYVPTRPSSDLSPADYAAALARLHAGLQQVELPVPSYLDRVREAADLVSDRDRSPDLAAEDRSLLMHTFEMAIGSIGARRAPEQPLHGEPHPGNVLNATRGPLFIDLETCCRGPVEFDLAHAPEAVSAWYPGVDHELLRDCRALVIAMIVAWRFEPGDRLPHGRQAARELLDALRAGPPYPPLGSITGLQ